MLYKAYFVPKYLKYVNYMFDWIVVAELLSSLVFEDCWSCGDLVWVCGFNSIFKCDASNYFCEVVKAA